MLIDCHMHTCHSFDADPSATPYAMCEAAIKKGLSAIAITDHFEINGNVEGIFPYFDPERNFEALCEVKEAFRGKLQVSVGVEVGQATEYPDVALDALQRYPYDFVLASLHNLPGVPDFSFFTYKSMSDTLCHRLFSRVIAETKRICEEIPGVCSIAHLNYMCRYMGFYGRTLDFAPHLEEMQDLFRTMIRKNIALELNVSPLRKGLDFCMPSEEILTLYRESGGTLLTIGSDSHTPDDVGANIADGYALLRRIGFDSVAFFTSKTPTFVSITE